MSGGAWYTQWALPPFQVAPIALGAFLYAVRARRLGPRLPAWRRWCFAGGVLTLLLAVCSPVDPIGENDLLSVHMLQHLMIGDIAPLLIALGITGPILRPVLALPSAERLRLLCNPLVALPLWALNLFLWHYPPLYEAAIRNDLVHAVEHVCFFGFGLLMWAALLESLPGPVWFGTGAKLAYVGGVRAATAILGNILWWSGAVLYGFYETRTPAFAGVSALEDQANAGTIMMVETGAITLVLILLLFFRMAGEGELRQRLIEAGLDPQAVRRAVRYGRADALAARHGISLEEDQPAGAARVSAE
jgi:putative membrane protein